MIIRKKEIEMVFFFVGMAGKKKVMLCQERKEDKSLIWRG